MSMGGLEAWGACVKIGATWWASCWLMPHRLMDPMEVHEQIAANFGLNRTILKGGKQGTNSCELLIGLQTTSEHWGPFFGGDLWEIWVVPHGCVAPQANLLWLTSETVSINTRRKKSALQTTGWGMDPQVRDFGFRPHNPREARPEKKNGMKTVYPEPRYKNLNRRILRPIVARGLCRSNHPPIALN